MIGESILHYRIVEKLGAGGMGEVYRARDTKLNRDVALKVLPADLARDPERRRRFEREAQAVAAVKHPNIITIYSVELADDIPFLTMELVEGQALSESIPEGGLPLARFFELSVPLVDAVAGAHAKGITHRDLKPANVMVDEGGRIKVLDFGLAKLFDPVTTPDSETLFADASATAEGRILGTAYYMSPEQAEGKPVDHRSDIFSLGIILYEMATGRRPFQGDTSMSVLSAIIKDTPSPVSEIAGRFPRHLDRIIQHCLAKDPNRRFQSALDVRNELEALKGEIDSGETVARSSSGGRRFRAKGPVLAIGAALLLVAAAVVGPRFLRKSVGHGPVRGSGESPAVGVIGFENLSDPEDSEHLGRMLMGLVTTDLAETRGLRVVTTPRILSALRQAGGDAQASFDAAVAGKAADLAGAEVMLVGQILQKGDRLFLTAELAEVKTGKTLGSMKKEAASGDDLFPLAEGIAEEVRVRLRANETPSETPDVDLTEILTDSPRAYRYYALGEVALQRQEWPQASEQFDRALREDPTFAMAYFRKAIATWWTLTGADALAILKEGEPYVGRLSDRGRALYRGVIAYFAGRQEEAYQTLTQLTTGTTESPEAFYFLGELCVHSPRYLDLDKARASFEKALDLDPTFTLALYHLIEELVQAEDLPAAERVIAACRAEAPDDPVLAQSELKLLNARGKFREAITLGEKLTAEGYSGADGALWTSMLCAGEREQALATAWRLAGAQTEELRHVGETQVVFGQLRAGVETCLKAIPLMDSPGNLNASSTWQDVSDVRLLTNDLDGAVHAAESAVAVAPEHFPAQASLARALQRAGRASGADSVLAGMERMVTERDSKPGAYWVDLARAWIHFLRGEISEASSTLDEAFRHPPIHRAYSREWFLRGQILDAQGDPSAAAEAYARAHQALGAPYWTDYVKVVLAVYLRARAEEKSGNPSAAREHYEQFLNYWGDADFPVPEVAEARARLKVLKAGS